MTVMGFPHSEILGSKVACHLPEAYRRLLRPSSALCCLAIHRTPLRASAIRATLRFNAESSEANASIHAYEDRGLLKYCFLTTTYCKYCDDTRIRLTANACMPYAYHIQIIFCCRRSSRLKSASNDVFPFDNEGDFADRVWG